jgi:hypothetical protein
VEAQRIGKKNDADCLHCKSRTGFKLTIEDINALAFQYFVQGSYLKTDYGGAHRVQFNDHWYGERQVRFLPDLTKDAHLIEDTCKIGFFYYGPSMWHVGGNTPLENLLNPTTRPETVAKIVSSFKRVNIDEETRLFRIRINPDKPWQHTEYDSAPKGKSTARFSNGGEEVWYGSEDLEICFHECRVAISDDLYVATVHPTCSLTLLDLTSDTPESGTPFDSLNVAVTQLFYAEKHSYEISTEIRKQAHAAKLDGIVFPSYFSQIKEDRIPNIALFGAPIASDRLSIKSIDRVILETVVYASHFGPVLPSDD